VEGVFQVRSTGGDSALGGDDFDRAIAQRALAARKVDAPSPAQIQRALFEARRAKEALTDSEEVELTLEGVSSMLHRKELEEWIQPLYQRTGLVCRRALKDAGMVPADLDGVLLVGGSTRVPAVRRYVEELFGKTPLGDIDPDQVVALGAAVQADLLTNQDRQDEVLLLDVIPLSLGLETMGGIVEKLIQRNSTIPTAAAQVFTTFQDGQTGMDIHVLQGERELVEDNRSLARFRLSGIPPLAAGIGRVEVRFQVDADGILHVSAKEQSTGTTQNVTVKPTHGLTDEEVEQMLLDSIEHAEEDIRTRQLREQRVEAQRILADARKQLLTHAELLQAPEREALEQALARLEESARGTDEDSIRAAIQTLDEMSRPFAERVMNKAVEKVLTGRSVEGY
jgi:molecular chaperone HscA